MRNAARRTGKKRRVTATTARASVPERMEARVLFSFAPYVFSHDGATYTATPSYEYLDAGAAGDATPLGSTSPNGAPLIPATMRAAYGLGSFTKTNGVYAYSYGISFNGVVGDGTGQTIAIVDVGSDPNIAADLKTFDTYYNLPDPPSFQQLSQTGSSTSLPGVAKGWPGEISLDVEWSHVMAPKANIILFAASDLYAADQFAAAYQGGSATDLLTGNTVTVAPTSVVSQSFGISGDVNDNTFLTPGGHAGVSFFAGSGDTGGEVGSPSQSVNCVSVGGTNLQVSNNGYGSESTWGAAGGGISSTKSQPSYQKGIVSPYSTTQRTIPDVSMDADPGSGVAVVNSYDSPAPNGPWELVIGGTSLATPLLAGVVAVADQGRVAEGLTNLDSGSQLLPRLYQLSQANYTGNYHDVTTGNNTHPATVGYDLATGIGTPNGANFIPALAGGNTVAGRAFVDANANGTYDGGTDTALSGRAVYLDLNNDGAQEPTDPTTTTAADGAYGFADVIGSITATVRLAGTTGYLQANTGTFTTGYGAATKAYNLVFNATTPVYSAAASPATTTRSTTLGVTTTGGAAASGLTYTWSATTVPAAGATATFAANGTAAAVSTTATFNLAGTYVLTAKIADTAGHTTYADVTVVVSQLLTSLQVPQQTGLSGGRSEPLTVNGYDQFGGLMGPQPAATWTLVGGGGAVTPAGTYTAPAAGTLATVQASATSGTGTTITATGTVPVVAAQWTSADVGNVVGAGVAYDANGTTTLVDQSDDIWNQSDDFRFDYMQVSGDVTVTAKLTSQTSNSSYIKAGVMIRNTLDKNSVMAMENNPAAGPLFEYRTATNVDAAQVATATNLTAPNWLRLVRSGTTFTGYSSKDGVTWTQTATQQLTMGTTVYVGLGLTSHDTNNVATATFTNVTVTPTVAQVLTSVKVLATPVNLTAGQATPLAAEAYDQNGLPMAVQPTFAWTLNGGGGTLTAAGVYTPPATGTLATVTATATATAGSVSGTGTVAVVQSPWTSLDIGNVNAPGTAYDSATTTTLTDQSDDIWAASDDFHFDYKTLTGDGSITARLNSQTSQSGYIKAGVMIRNTLDPASAMAMENDPAQPGSLFEWRTAAAGTAAQVIATGTTAPPNAYLRLTRVGNVITGFSSTNGTTWVQTGQQTIPMNQTVYAGLALTSHDTGHSATAVFSNVTVVGTGPAVATAAAASPATVTGTTTALSVLGAGANGESTLTYTWAATSLPAGAAAPTFSANGTNAAKATTATFKAVGTYTFTVTITDAGGQTATSTATVVVTPTLTSVAVTPATATLNENGTKAFAATGYDQFAAPLATQPTFAWTKTAGVGAVSSTGVYASPGTTGTATVQAAAGGVAGTATVTVNNGTPAVASGATATPSPVTGKTAALSVLGTDDGGEANLTYTWSTLAAPAGAGLPTFAANGTNAAKNTTATFAVAGNYTFQVAVADASGLTTTSVVGVTVVATPTTLVLTPATATVLAGQTAQFAASALDQFGAAVATPSGLTWTVDAGGVGSVSPTGLYTAAASGSAVVRATAGSATGTAAVAVIPPVIAGTAGDDTIRLVRSGANLLVYVDNPTTPAYTLAYASVPGLTVTTGAGNDAVLLDFSGGGSPVPTGGLAVNGGGGAGDTLTFLGTAAADTATVAGSAVTFDGSTVAYAGLGSIVVDGGGGADTLNQTAQPGGGATTLTFNATVDDGTSTTDTLNVSGGTFAFAAPESGSGNNLLLVGNLAVGNGAAVSLGTSATPGDRTLLYVKTLTLTGAGSTLDLGGNDLEVRGTAATAGATLATVSADVTAGGPFAAGTTGPAITSTAAAANPTQMTLGVALAGSAVTTLDGQPVGSNDVLVKYTRFGDADLSGAVDGQDYTRIDAGYAAAATATPLTGWYNGDFNGDGKIDGSDYTLIDNAFNLQPQTAAPQATIASQVATPAAAVAAATATARSKRSAPTFPFNAGAPITLSHAPAGTTPALSAGLDRRDDAIDRLGQR